MKRGVRQTMLLAISLDRLPAVTLLRNPSPPLLRRRTVRHTRLAENASRCDTSSTYCPRQGAFAATDTPAQRKKRPRGLADVYRALGLPAVAVSTALPKGERAMLEKCKLTALVDELHDADRRVPPTKPTSKAKSVGRA